MRKRILIFCFLMNILYVEQSFAEDVCYNMHNNAVQCIEKLADEEGHNACGINCLYDVVKNSNGDSVLHIYKKDASLPASIREGAFSPNFYADGVVKDNNENAVPLENIVFDNDFETIGAYAFSGSGAQISSASGKFVFNDVDPYITFWGNTTLNGDIYFNKNVSGVLEESKVNGDIIFADGVTNVGWFFAGNAEINGNIIIPKSVQSIDIMAFAAASLTGKIYCAAGVESCYEMIKAGCKYEDESYNNTCLNRLEDMSYSGQLSAYPKGCDTLGSGALCTKCKSESFRLTSGKCHRLIYTIDEANRVAGPINRISITYR